MTGQPSRAPPSRQNDFTIIWAATVVPGNAEAWRRFAQEMASARHTEFVEMCQQLGIEAMQIWIAETVKGDVGVIAVIATEPAQVMRQMADLQHSFARWLRTQLHTLHGVDIAHPPSPPLSDLVLDWRIERK